jgi:hypothetical protein
LVELFGVLFKAAERLIGNLFTPDGFLVVCYLKLSFVSLEYGRTGRPELDSIVP